MNCFVSSKSGRRLWEVQSDGPGLYLCLRDYCSCSSFSQSVLLNGEATVVCLTSFFLFRVFRSHHPLQCKHLLACRLAQAMKICDETMISDEKFNQKLLWTSADPQDE
eukprot:c18082_g1_i2.p1 GENE.c18082_g1_i2~~c18082_g1_i2.p1  ORF type:complete len:108 (+),score=15.93 c18082_g1_i2:379-702(+)